jgi:chromosome partitioning protein
MGYVYAIANQKGGVGKTTTTVNLAACFAEAGRQTLVVDLDPQCNATVTLGLDRKERPSAYDTLSGEVSVAEAARPTAFDNLWVVPANRDLAGAAVELPALERSEYRLRDGLGPVRERFAATFLDCPPSLGRISSTGTSRYDGSLTSWDSGRIAASPLPIPGFLVTSQHLLGERPIGNGPA